MKGGKEKVSISIPLPTGEEKKDQQLEKKDLHLEISVFVEHYLLLRLSVGTRIIWDLFILSIAGVLSWGLCVRLYMMTVKSKNDLTYGRLVGANQIISLCRKIHKKDRQR
jgi:hypothetical protein